MWWFQESLSEELEWEPYGTEDLDLWGNTVCSLGLPGERVDKRWESCKIYSAPITKRNCCCRDEVFLVEHLQPLKNKQEGATLFFLPILQFPLVPLFGRNCRKGISKAGETGPTRHCKQQSDRSKLKDRLIISTPYKLLYEDNTVDTVFVIFLCNFCFSS